MSRADERARGADSKAQQAAEEARRAHEAARSASERAGAASRSADSAGSLARKSLDQTAALDLRIAGLENFQVIGEHQLLFAFDSTELGKEARQTLEQAAGETRGLHRYAVEVKGFADRIGKPEYNLELSRRRANTVVQYLAAHHGVPVHRIFAAGLGIDKPVSAGDTKDGRARNRRVEVRVFSADGGTTPRKIETSSQVRETGPRARQAP